MKNYRQTYSLSVMLRGFFIAIGLGYGGFFIGRAIECFKTSDRTVVVKGISEREVKADLAIWDISLTNTGNDLSILAQKIKAHETTLYDFLEKKGFKKNDIQSGISSIHDKLARDWDNNTVINRYVWKKNLSICTSDVDLVLQTTSALNELIEKGIILSGDPCFYYTRLADLRPQMIAEATKSARLAAMQFATDSGASVGAIRYANQGIFSIRGKAATDERYDYKEYASINKKVRVVSTITFSLEKHTA